MHTIPRPVTRILSLLLSGLLAISLAPSPTFAEDMLAEDSATATSVKPGIKQGSGEGELGVQGPTQQESARGTQAPVTTNDASQQPSSSSATTQDLAAPAEQTTTPEPVAEGALGTTEHEPSNQVEADRKRSEPDVATTATKTDAKAAADADEQGLGAMAQASAPTISVLTHVQNEGWAKGWTENGAVAGTTGRSLRMEAIRLRLNTGGARLSLRGRAHVENVGWQDWKNNDEPIGTQGASQRIEAMQIQLTGDDAKSYDVWYRVHAQNYGWMGWTKNGAVAGTAGKSLRLEAVQVAIVRTGGQPPKGPAQNTSAAFLGNESISLQAHVQNVGWMAPVGNGAIAGTTGRGLRLEALRPSLNGARVPGGVEVNAHVQNIGWQGWNGTVAGTVGHGLRVEAICMRLTGEAAATYDLYYRVHVQNVGWLSWAPAGENAGSTGLSLHVEAVQAMLVQKGAAAPGNGDARYPLALISPASIKYETFIQGSGWQGLKDDGQVAGTTGKGLRVEGLRAKVYSEHTTGGISYRAHVQNVGWQNWTGNGGDAGQAGSGRQIEAIQVSLNGMVSQVYNVWYRVHVQNIGWMGWTCNGNPSGTVGYGYRVEAVQICLRGIGAGAPGSTSDAYRDANVFANLNRASGSGGVTAFNGYAPSPGVVSRLNNAVNRIRGSGYDVGMIMMDLAKGTGVACNPDAIFYSASTIKGPYVASLVEARPGTLRSEARRIQSVLRYSDNDAYTQLRGIYGPSSLSAWCASSAVRGNVASGNYTYYSARELAKLWARANMFFSGSPVGAELGGWFQSPEISVIRSMLAGRYVTRSKAGWIGMAGYNATGDAGLVYAPNGTYVMAILTNAPAQFHLLQDAVLAMDAAHSEM